MIRIDIPGREPLELSSLVLDLNGTLAVDGEIISGVEPRLAELAERLDVFLLTADTLGRAAKLAESLPLLIRPLPPGPEDQAKLSILNEIGPKGAAFIGNGANDELCLGAAALGVAVVQAEGGAVSALLKADLAVTSILDGLDLLLIPTRLIASLRV